MKKLAAIATTCALVITLAGCAGGESKEPTEQNEPATAKTQQEAKPQELQTAESGFWVDDYSVAHYAAIIENPNQSWAAEHIPVTITARDAGGNVLNTINDSITLMFPAGKTAISGDVKAPSGTATLDVVAKANSQGWTKCEDVSQKSFYDLLPITGINETTGDFGAVTVAGEVSNNTEGTFSLARVNIVWRDAGGVIVGGCYTYLNGEFSAGATQPFSAIEQGVPEHATVEAYLDCGFPLNN